MNNVFLIIYVGLIAALLALFFIGPTLAMNKFVILGIFIGIFLFIAFLFDHNIYDKMEHIKKLKIEKGMKFFSAKLLFYMGMVSLAVIIFIWFASSGLLAKFLKEDTISKTDLNGTVITCVDNDKEDYFSKGFVQLTINDLKMPKEYDVCQSKDVLIEKTCDSGKISQKMITCIEQDATQGCVDGKCVKEEQTTPTKNDTLSINLTITANDSNTDFSNTHELNITELLLKLNLTINENSTNFWNTSEAAINGSQVFVNITIVSSGGPIIRNLIARPDSFSDTGMVDNDPNIFITWDLIATKDTKCYGSFGDKSSLREVGIDGLDVATGLKGYNRFYLRCCNKYACDFEETNMKIEIAVLV